MNIGFIGFGNMARALAEGFVRSGAVAASQIGGCARDQQKLHSYTTPRGFTPFATAEEVVAFADVVVIAVKPYQVETVVAPLQALLRTKIVLSVAAGIFFDRYEELLAPGIHHLSTNPNTPVAVCEGIVACERRHSLTDEEWTTVEALFNKVGKAIVVDTALMDVASIICGCAPAFVALFMEALGDAGLKHGIPRAEAYRMVSQVMIGTGKLQLETGQHPGVMKDAVCSPGGTTIIGVAELERHAFRGAVIAAVDAIRNKK